MIKCKECIFCFDEKCKNPESDWADHKVFEKYDGCNYGKKSAVGITALQRLVLVNEANRRQVRNNVQIPYREYHRENGDTD